VVASEAAEAPVAEARARSVLGSDLVALGEIDRGLDELAEAARLSAAADVPSVAVVAHHNRAVSLIAVDRFEEAHAEAMLGREVARAGGLERRYGPHLLGSAADALLRLGRLEDALEVAEAGRRLSPGGGGAVYLDAVGARGAALRGRTEEAAKWLARAEALAERELDPDLAAYLATARATVALADGRAGDAVEVVAAALADPAVLDEPAWAAPLVAEGAKGVAELVADRPRREPAHGYAADVGIGAIEAAAEHLGSRATTATARASLLVARALLATTADGSPAPWTAAVEAWDSVGATLEAADSRYRAAEAMLRQRRDRATASTLLAESYADATKAGAGPLTRAIRLLARQARVELEPAAPEPAKASVGDARRSAAGAYPGPALSERELEVLALVADGRSNGEIAETLFITRKTASVHVSHILDKLGVSSRVEAAILAARLGVLGPPSDAAAAGATMSPPRRGSS
ncbi:MAG TPA: LuxR C-terminal-related transcriptional regulator, partial [Candidatus Limnocylindrales bacterium]